MFLSDTPSDNWWSSLDKSDDSSRTWSVLLVNGLFVGWATIIVLLRAITKCSMAMKLFLDDFLMIGSVVFFITFCVLNIYAATLGFGHHIWALPGLTDPSTSQAMSAAVARVQKINYVALTILAPAIILAKLSVVAILLRIFPPAMRALRVFLLGLGVVVIGCCTTQAMIIIFQCFPVEASWDMARSGGTACYIKNLDAVVMGMGALNVLTDLVICLTPIPYFWKLKLPRFQKMCLCGLFLSGLVACGISIVRVLSLRGLRDNFDVTYATAPYFNWSCAEVGLIIIAGSVPSLRPLLATILPEFLREHNFSFLFASENKRATAMSTGNYKLSDGDDSWRSLSKGTGVGTITITKEYQIEELRKERRSVRASHTVSTPLTPGFGPRAIVTCERVKSVS